ncbi:Cellulose synthase-like protein D3 [Linum grandiflorum]
MANNNGRRAATSPAIHQLSNSRDFDDSDIGSVEFSTYTVHIPPTPDNQPMAEEEESSPPFRKPAASTYNTYHQQQVQPSSSVRGAMTRTFPAPVASSSFCQVPGCDAMAEESSFPCDCEFKICRDCFNDAAGGDGICPGCKSDYHAAQVQVDRTLSVIKKPAAHHDFDSDFLFDSSKKDYNNAAAAAWSTSCTADHPNMNMNMNIQLAAEPKPLTRKLNIPATILGPYRVLILIRMIALAMFIEWRVTNPNEEAMWLWGMSVICELWFSFSWLLDQLPKLCPVKREVDLQVLKDKFETPNPNNPTGKSDLPGVDFFVSTADPEKEPPLVTANTILSILAADYPVEKLSCYVSDDGGALLTFEAMAEAASFARLWVPFCRKHNVEPRNPESYFNLKTDPYKNKVRADFVRDRRRVKREYDEFKVCVNGLPNSIRRRSDAYNTHEEIKIMKKKLVKERSGDDDDEQIMIDRVKIPKATWMTDGTHWAGTWTTPSPDHTRGDHASIIQVMLQAPSEEPIKGSSTSSDGNSMDLSEVDIRLPMLVYVSREKRPGYDHNKKAGAMNALVRASAVMSNGPFILNLDCDHYIYNSQALREGMCFMMDADGDGICYVQFPQRFEGIDPSDRYANQNTVFFDVNMLALDGIQGPVYVGTGCLFRRTAIYGFEPPSSAKLHNNKSRKIRSSSFNDDDDDDDDDDEDAVNIAFLIPKKFGNSSMLVDSIRTAAYQGLPLADHPSIKNGRPPGALIGPREPLKTGTIGEAVNVISCWYEDKTEWGVNVGWIYGSVTEDVVTGFRMHEKGWRSVYCVTKRDAFRGTAPINLTDRLHQVLRWATGSVEIFFSRNNALLAGSRLKFLQRVAYLNVGIYPFTSVFLLLYCFLPALSLFANKFIVNSLDVTFLTYLLIITVTITLLAVLEIKWSGIALEEWWRNEQFWLIGGTSAHLAAVLQGLLKVIAGVEISFTLTSKSAADEDDEFAELYIIKWTSLMIPPCTIIIVNIVAIAVGFSRTIYSEVPQWNNLIGGAFFSFWVLVHLYPFAKGLMGRRGKTPTIVFVWSALISICISLLWVAINPPAGQTQIGGSFQLPS